MNIQIDEFQVILKEIEALKRLLNSLLSQNRLVKEWYTAKECAELKGINYGTYCNSKFHQIKGGISNKQIAGNKCWSREEVVEWLSLTDEQLNNYHYKYRTGAERKTNDDRKTN